jgi:iron(III) transport system substrate-binding protein
MVPYESEQLPKLIPGSRQDGWTADRINKFVVSWNTRLVRPGQQPRSWEELAEDKWKGKLALEASDADWYKGLHDYWVQKEGKPEAEVNRLFEAIARNSRVVTGHSLMGELLGAGEYSVAVSNYNHLIQDSIDKGAPVAKKPTVEPVLSRAAGVGLVRGAPHPAAAVLFHDWILSADGQKTLTKFNLDPARKGIPGTLRAREFRIDIQDFIAHQQEWVDHYDRLTSLGSAVKGGG